MDDALTILTPPQKLVILYAKQEAADLLTIFLILDSRLRNIHTHKKENMIAQMRLAWWRDVITANERPRGEPLISLIDQYETEYDKSTLQCLLLNLVNAWEERIFFDNDTPDKAILDFAAQTGGMLFTEIAGQYDIIANNDIYTILGEIWALSSFYDDRNEISHRAMSLAAKEIQTIWSVINTCKLRVLTLLSYPAVRTALNKDDTQSGIGYGLTYIWHAISGKW